jgi:hypothetical protein
LPPGPEQEEQACRAETHAQAAEEVWIVPDKLVSQILESQDDMSVVDGATIEPRIHINRPDDENTRCRISSVRGQPKDFSQLTQPPTTLSTSNVISLLQGRTEPFARQL